MKASFLKEALKDITLQSNETTQIEEFTTLVMLHFSGQHGWVVLELDSRSGGLNFKLIRSGLTVVQLLPLIGYNPVGCPH